MKLTKTNITLGRQYKDTVTSIEGTATASIEYLEGESQVRLESASHDGKEVKEHWFPIGRLEFKD